MLSLLSAYKGLKPIEYKGSGKEEFCLLSAYKGLKQKCHGKSGNKHNWFIKCL